MAFYRPIHCEYGLHQAFIPVDVYTLTPETFLNACEEIKRALRSRYPDMDEKKLRWWGDGQNREGSISRQDSRTPG
jgi:hypothetical protein